MSAILLGYGTFKKCGSMMVCWTLSNGGNILRIGLPVFETGYVSSLALICNISKLQRFPTSATDLKLL